MVNAVVFKSGGAITNPAQPPGVRDKMINAGTLSAIDLAKSYCIDLSITPVDGATVKNLVPGAPDAILKVPTPGDLIAVPGKGLQLKASSNRGRVQIGTGTQYLQSGLDHDLIIWTWVTFPASDPGGGHIGMIFSKGADATNYGVVGPWLAQRWAGQGGLPDIQGKFDSNNVANGYSLNSANTEPDPASPSGLHQVGIAKVGSNVIIYRDGVQVGASGALGSPLLTANSNPFDWGNHAISEVCPRGTILHRWFLEDLTVSTKTAAGQIAADYTVNTGRFV